MNILLLLAGLSGNLAEAAPALEPQPLANESYGEAYTAVSLLDDGSYALMQLMFTNAGVGSRKAVCRALWVPPGKAGINASTQMSSKEWAYDAATSTLTAGECSIGVTDGGLRFVARVPDLSITLDLAAPLNPVQPPDHRIEHNGAFYQARMLVPYAKVSASIASASGTVTTTGKAHIDHSRSNLLMPNAAACWLRFRGFVGSTPTLMQVRIPPGGGAPSGWVWPLSSAKPVAVASDRIRVRIDENGRPAVSLLGDHRVEVGTTQALYVYRPADAYGALGRLASPWIGDPTTTTYKANGSSAGDSVSGILEVLRVDDPGCATQ